MSLLRIRAALADAPVRCSWALVNEGRDPVSGEGSLAELPRGAARVQLVIPAADVLITRARLPASARRHAGSVLAYAVEEQTTGEPDNCQVSWLGSAGSDDVLAVVAKPGLRRWLDALDAAGVRAPDVQCETLLLPRAADEWSLAWDGQEGFVRTSQFEGAVTDCGDRDTPPLSLRLLLDEAEVRGQRPVAIAIYSTGPSAAPDLAAWQRELGVALRMAGPWDWRAASPQAGVSLAQQRRRWRMPAGMLGRLRPAAWITVAALGIHVVASITDWTLLAREQQTLRRDMEARFRVTFPDAIAVVDPGLQMRRKLVEARHAAGQSDAGDFLPLIEQVAAAAGFSDGAVRTLSYDNGHMTLELSAMDEAGITRIVERLRQSGLSVDTTRAPDATVVLTVRTS